MIPGNIFHLVRNCPVEISVAVSVEIFAILDILRDAVCKPISPPANCSGRSNASVVMQVNPPHTHLLLIDEDAAARRLVAHWLRKDGFLVTEAGSGEAGLRLFAAGYFHLVLMDVMMEGGNGFDVCRAIRASIAGATIPILLLTSLEDPQSIERGFSAGATDFISKPVNLTLLSYRIRHAVHGRVVIAGEYCEDASLARAQDMAGIGHWKSDADGAVTCSRRLADLLGIASCTRAPTDLRALTARVAPCDRERVERARSNLAAHGIAYELQFQVMRDDGQVRDLFEHATPVTDEHGRGVGMEGIVRDVTEQARTRQTIHRLANVDAVTGLPNHDYFDTLIAPLFARAGLEGGHCNLLHISLDRFTSISEAMGRVQADCVLAMVAQRLSILCGLRVKPSRDAALSRDAVLARIGPSSFACCLIGFYSLDELRDMSHRILAGLSDALPTATHDLSLSASIGIASAPGSATTPGSLAHCAAQAAAAVGRCGGGHYRFFNETMNTLATERLQIESDLRRAIVNRELRLHFQPLVDAAAQTLTGAEALIRWQHPLRGLLGAEVFLGIAEQSGLMGALTDWVLAEACRSLCNWQQAGLRSLPLSINLPTTSLLDSGLVGKLDALLRQYHLSPDSLKLEMTETLLMQDVDTSVAVLEKLRARGFSLSIDDFGTGYSSLGYLRRLPVHELKIDRTFITNAARGGPDAVLAKTIIVLGREFGLRAVAEGVETTAQSDFFTAHGCVHQQGYLFSRPVPGAAYGCLLADSRSLFTAASTLEAV
jgi:diguanylate cyclase (GGDEF)-like protein